MYLMTLAMPSFRKPFQGHVTLTTPNSPTNLLWQMGYKKIQLIPFLIP